MFGNLRAVSVWNLRNDMRGSMTTATTMQYLVQSSPGSCKVSPLASIVWSEGMRTYSEVYLSKNLLIFLLKTLLRSLMYVMSPSSASSLARLFLA